MSTVLTRALGCRGSSSWCWRSSSLFHCSCQFHARRRLWTSWSLRWQHAKGGVVMYNYRCDSDCRGIHTETHTHNTCLQSFSLICVTFLTQRIQLECFINLFLEKCVTLRPGLTVYGYVPDIQLESQKRLSVQSSICVQVFKIAGLCPNFCTEIRLYYL